MSVAIRSIVGAEGEAWILLNRHCFSGIDFARKFNLSSKLTREVLLRLEEEGAITRHPHFSGSWRMKPAEDEMPRPGFTLRDRFANTALRALLSELSKGPDPLPRPAYIAECAYGYADAMLAQRAAPMDPT